MEALRPDLTSQLQQFLHDPLGHVMYSYPWSTNEMIQKVRLEAPWRARYESDYGPDAWVCAWLDRLGEDAALLGFDGTEAVNPILKAISHGHGIGSCALTAWVAKWLLDTRPMSRGVVTAATKMMLDHRVWYQILRWHGLSRTREWFELTDGKYSALKHVIYPDEWSLHAIPWSVAGPEGFAGLMVPRSTAFWLFNGADVIDSRIFDIRNACLADAGEGMAFDFGQSFSLNSVFYEECWGNLSDRWDVTCVDSRDSMLGQRHLFRALIEDHGIDSDIVRTRVRGLPPRAL